MTQEIFYRPHKALCADGKIRTVRVRSYWDGQGWCNIAMTKVYKATEPNIDFSAKEGYHNWVDGMGSFEVFWNSGALESDEPNKPAELGWYWWRCFPGCLPDGEATGPFYSSSAAYADARG